MSERCKEGQKYECPYRKDCESDGGTINSINPNNPHRIYVVSTDWSDTTRTWVNEDSLYACQPEQDTRRRNIAIMSGETFLGRDMKRQRQKVLTEAQETIKNLISLVNGR